MSVSVGHTFYLRFFNILFYTKLERSEYGGIEFQTLQLEHPRIVEECRCLWRLGVRTIIGYIVRIEIIHPALSLQNIVSQLILMIGEYFIDTSFSVVIFRFINTMLLSPFTTHLPNYCLKAYIRYFF